MLPPVRGVSLSQALAEAAAVAPTGRALLLALEFWRPSFDEPARIVNDKRPMTARIEAGAPRNAGAMVDWLPVAMDATWPSESDDSATPAGRLTIDGVSPVLATQLDGANGSLDPTIVIWRLYASDDLEGPAMLPVLTMELSDVQVTDLRVTAAVSRPSRGTRRFPARAYTRLSNPGLSA